MTSSGIDSLTRRPRFTPCKISGTLFCQRLSKPLGHITDGMDGLSETKSNDLIGNRTREPLRCIKLAPNFDFPNTLHLRFTILADTVLKQNQINGENMSRLSGS
jgi:hypothetical protein